MSAPEAETPLPPSSPAVAVETTTSSSSSSSSSLSSSSSALSASKSGLGASLRESVSQAAELDTWIEDEDGMAFNRCLGLTAEQREESAVTQWAHSVVSFSSQYSDPGWSAQKVLGAPTFYPGYGDHSECWAPGPRGTAEFITVKTERLMEIFKIEVYETYCPGGIVKITAISPGSPDKVIWTGSTKCKSIHAAQIAKFEFAPVLAQTFRFDIDQNGEVSEWYEIDAIKFYGTDPDAIKPASEEKEQMDFDSNENFTSLIASLYNSSIGSDFTFLLSDSLSSAPTTRLPVHRCILIQRSKYFRDLEEQGSFQAGGTKVIDDIPAPLFRIVLEWIYTNKITGLEAKYVVPLYVISQFYQCTGLSDLCLEAFKLVLSPKSCIQLYNQFNKCHLPNLRDVAFEFAINSLPKVVDTPAFRNLSPETMHHFFSTYLARTVPDV